MHLLHDYVAKQLAEKLKSKRIVVWYDARREFAPFVGEVRGGARTSNGAVPVTVAGIATQLAEYDGSMFDLRATVEPYVSGDAPEYVVIYVPGCERDRRGSVLMELVRKGDVRKGDGKGDVGYLLYLFLSSPPAPPHGANRYPTSPCPLVPLPTGEWDAFPDPTRTLPSGSTPH